MFNKQIISVLMLFLIISHGTVQLFILKVFQTQHRKNIQQSIDSGMFEDDLILFKFNKDEFEKGLSHIEWIEDDEFRIDEGLYDIVEKNVTDDFVYLYCYDDKKESILYLGLFKIFNRLFGDETNNVRNLTMVNSLLSDYYFCDANELNKYYLQESSRYLTIKTFKLLNGEHFIDTPPPRS